MPPNSLPWQVHRMLTGNCTNTFKTPWLPFESCEIKRLFVEEHWKVELPSTAQWARTETTMVPGNYRRLNCCEQRLSDVRARRLAPGQPTETFIELESINVGRKRGGNMVIMPVGRIVAENRQRDCSGSRWTGNDDNSCNKWWLIYFLFYNVTVYIRYSQSA